MTGTAKVKPAKDDAEWARNTQRRLEQVEHPASSRIGNWVLSTDSDTGDLIASNVNGGSVVIANEPEGDGDADVVASGWSHLKVSRQAVQSVSVGSHVPIEWDTVDSQSDGWSVAAGSSSFVIPESGIWLVIYNLYFTTNTGVTRNGRFWVDGAARISSRSEGGSFPTLACTDVLGLSAGSEIYATTWAGSSGVSPYQIGPDDSSASSVTSLTLTRLPIG